MVSRSNLSGRKPFDGVIGRAYKGPSGPGNVTLPGEEVRDIASSGARLPAKKHRLGKPISTQLQSPIEQSRSQQAALSSPVNPVQGGLVKPLEAAALNPVAPQPEVGGNLSLGTPTLRGSAASRSRRNIR